MADLSQLRMEYGKQGLSEADLHPDPIVQFQNWLHEAIADGLHEPYAMTLATVSPDGTPSARIVLLREANQSGFTFFSNYLSRKGRELEQTGRAALVFYWGELERQVRIEGEVARTEEATSDDYFSRRPRNSQLSAVISSQSEVIVSRSTLEERMNELSEKLKDQPVPRPAHWGGYRLVPRVVEFWQGRPSRLHDRLRYRLESGVWIIERLSP